MPYPRQVTADEIVTTAHGILERDGIEKLSLARIASELGVRSPSLYRYFRNKETLQRAVNLRTLQGLFERIDAALACEYAEPRARLLAVAQALRGFAHAHPDAYTAAMTAQVSVTRPEETTLVEMVLPVQRVMAEVCGDKHSLTALRGLFALAHGYTLLEIQSQLQRGGDLDAAFVDSVSTYLDGWRLRSQD